MPVNVPPPVGKAARNGSGRLRTILKHINVWMRITRNAAALTANCLRVRTIISLTAIWVCAVVRKWAAVRPVAVVRNFILRTGAILRAEKRV